MIPYIGNFKPPYSTENDIAWALTENGHDVYHVQEDDWSAGRVGLPATSGLWDLEEIPFVLWTRTWPTPPDRVAAELAPYRDAGIPIVGYHLDVWWGLTRQADIYTDPYFRDVDLLVTADGGSQRLFNAAGIRHKWMPPAVSERHPWLPTPNLNPDRWPTGVVFVGNEQYHPEWSHRTEMVQRLSKRYGRQFTSIPGKGRPAIRGQDLADIYASAGVVVGDSCFAGIRPRYWSDRVPETLARGGLLAHPDTDWSGMFSPGYELEAWRIGDWDGMFGVIDRMLEWDDDEKELRRHTARETVSAFHTYRTRMRSLEAAVQDLMVR